MKMRKRSIAYLVCTMIVLLSIIGLFVVKYSVSNVKREMETMDKKLSVRQKQLEVIDAEWAYLTTPSRIEKLANNYLKDNKIIAAKQLKSIDQLRPVYMARLNDQKRNIAMGF